MPANSRWDLIRALKGQCIKNNLLDVNLRSKLFYLTPSVCDICWLWKVDWMVKKREKVPFQKNARKWDANRENCRSNAYSQVAVSTVATAAFTPLCTLNDWTLSHTRKLCRYSIYVDCLVFGMLRVSISDRFKVFCCFLLVLEG